MFSRVTPEEAHKLTTDDGYTMLDVRTVAEFEEGHPPGAYNIPLLTIDPATGMRRPNTAFLEEVQACFPSDTKLVLTCRSGGRSARAAALLVEAGYADVIDQRAGWDGERDVAGKVRTPGWVDAGLPVQEGDGGERSYASCKAG